MSGNDDIAVKVVNLHKTFKIPLEGGKNLKQKIVNFSTRKKGYREFSPLNGVNFEIKKGEFFGIVGRNGSGKSTLLKTIAGIYEADKGYVKVNGTLVPFIELGVGFNPELTGRENVYLNGALLGFSREEMTSMYDEIVDFAELHEFMDEKLKNYSSGMQVRLAFSIAIRAEGDILILDEVLAVGDEAFQRKCYDYFSNLRKKKKTVILVTHSMPAVELYCSRAMLLEDGNVKSIGKPSEIATMYSKSNDDKYEKNVSDNSDSNKKFSNIDIQITDTYGKSKKSFKSGEVIHVKLKWHYDNVRNVGVSIIRSDGMYMYGTNTYIEKISMEKGTQEAAISIRANLAEGAYFIRAGLFGDDDQDRVDYENEGPKLIINREKSEHRWGGVTKLESEWF